MTDYRITANQNNLATGNGDNTFIAPGVVVNGGIDMRGIGVTNGGNQTVTLDGILFDGIDDYFTPTSGDDQIFIGSTGVVDIDWFGAVELAGGGNIIVNAGEISSMTYGDAIYLLGSVGADQTTADVITNTGTISGISEHPDRAWADATIYVASAAGVTVTNSGSILSATGYAMSLGAGNVSVTNTGFIQGGVQLGSGSNFFDSRQGTITGGIYGHSGSSDVIYGSKGDDTIIGGAGNDRIDGYAGADDMIGGAGDDSYYVDNTGDIVDENNTTWGGGGSDTIYSSINFDLANSAQVIGSIETLVLTGTADLDATGTVQAETISGNIGDNVIFGGGGNDILNGGGGNDRLYGGGGNDTLNGGSGADVMYGGPGNDTYVVDNIGDVANEAVAGSGGTDVILSSISLSLANTAQVKGSIENLTLRGTGSLSGTGNSLANVIIGNSGKNMLDGGLGNDTLTGGAGADQFVFSTAPNTKTNCDTITDFVHGTDKIVLDKSVFTAFTKTGSLSAANFAINAAKDANDFVVYNTTTGVLSYDKDGNRPGASVQFASLTGVPGITQADILIG